MEHTKVTEALHRTAGLLFDLANELQETIRGSGQANENNNNGTNRDMVAGRIQTYWRESTGSPLLSIGSVDLDLSTKEGKWELLVVALLRAARVTEDVVEATFHELRSKGLLAIERLLADDSEVRSEIGGVLEKTYKALGHRDAKREALFYNARWLQSAWDGDLQKLYESAADDDELLAALRQFRQIDRIALWICRTMYVHGVWPEVGPSARRYVDRPVRLPLQRLGLVDTTDLSSGFRPGVEEIEYVISKHFSGDVAPLYLHGSGLCAKNDPEICLAHCPVAAWCSFARDV